MIGVPRGWTLRRAWPHGNEVILELLDYAGLIRAGRQTPDGSIEIADPVTDQALPGLAASVSTAGGPSAVFAHRLSRRAVLREGPRWIKVVRSGKVAGIADRHRHFAAAVVATGTQVPPLVAVDEELGRLVFGHLDGLPILDHPDPRAAASHVAGTLVRWWRSSAPACLPVHDAAAECAVLDSWATAAAHHGVIPIDRRDELRSAVRTACETLRALPSRPLVLSHRDLHDEQLLIDGDRVGVLDLDTAARADRALDTGNLLAHLDLATATGRLTPATAATLAAVLCEPLDTPTDRAALAAYRRAARVRLVCVHAFRPATHAAAMTLLCSGRPLLPPDLESA